MVLRSAPAGFGRNLCSGISGLTPTVGDYGDLGLTINAYMPIARMMVELSGHLCGGRLEVVLGGGSRSDIARSVIPPIIAVLGEAGSS